MFSILSTLLTKSITGSDTLHFLLYLVFFALWHINMFVREFERCLDAEE